MLRAAWRVLSSSKTPPRGHRRQSLGCRVEGALGFPLTIWVFSKFLEVSSSTPPVTMPSRNQTVQPSQEDDPPPSTLLKDYQNIPGIEKADDIVKRLLSLEMANKKEMLKIKKEQLMNRIVANPEDKSSLEARIVALTVKIQSYEEHMQKHQKDKAHKQYLLMSIDLRKKMLKNLHQTNYDVFEKTCKELQIKYTCPPVHNWKPHQHMMAKKALCLQVFQEAQKLKKQRRVLKPAAAIQKQEQRGPRSPSKAEPETVNSNQ